MHLISIDWDLISLFAAMKYSVERANSKVYSSLESSYRPVETLLLVKRNSQNKEFTKWQFTSTLSYLQSIKSVICTVFYAENRSCTCGLIIANCNVE